MLDSERSSERTTVAAPSIGEGDDDFPGFRHEIPPAAVPSDVEWSPIVDAGVRAERTVREQSSVKSANAAARTLSAVRPEIIGAGPDDEPARYVVLPAIPRMGAFRCVDPREPQKEASP
jgi:hypothetical protein